MNIHMFAHTRIYIYIHIYIHMYISSRLLQCETRWIICSWYRWLHMGAYICIRMHVGTIFIDFHRFSLISEGFEAIRARRLAGLGPPVASDCGYLGSLQDVEARQGALCSIGRLKTTGWVIVRYCTKGPKLLGVCRIARYWWIADAS